MGRVKLKLKTVESETGRIVTYSKRKNALLKKTNELAVLCEIDIVLLMFSPTGKVALQMGNAVKFNQIIRRFANTSAEERARSNTKVYETLKKSYKNSDHEVQAKYFSATRFQSVEDLNAQSNLLQNQLAKTQERLSDWRNPDKIESVELLGQMEDYLKDLFDQIKSRKNQINLTSSVGGGTCRNIFSTLNQNFDIKSSFRVDSDMCFVGNNFDDSASRSNSNLIPKSTRVPGNDSLNIASSLKSNFLVESPRGELRVSGLDSQNIASLPRPICPLQREPQIGTSLTAACLSRCENTVIDSNGDYTNNHFQTELLRNEFVSLKQEAQINEFARSDFLINAYNGAEYMTNDFRKEGTKNMRNYNELLRADNSRVCVFSLNQKNIVPLQSQIPSAQQVFVPKQKQNLYQQQDIVSLEETNMEYSFGEGNLEPSTSNHDPVLEWSGSFGALDFALSDSQRPLSVDDYETEVLPQPTNQPKSPYLIAISKNETGCINL